MAVIMVALLGASAAAGGVPVRAQGSGSAFDAASGSASFADRFGLDLLGGEFTSISPSASWALVGSGYGLGSVDLFSGSLVPGDVTSVLSPDRAIVHDMMADGLLAFDTQQVAEEARRTADLRRAEAERQAMLDDEDFDIDRFSTCGVSGNANFTARIDTVAAFEQLCRAAERDGVRLRIVSALRTPSEQHALYQRAIAKYGSAEAARRWVAPSDGRNCQSNHCKGVAVDVSVSDDAAARAWLHATVGCYVNGAAEMGRTSCSTGRPIKNVQRYGFIFPMAHEPWHMELAAPLR